MIFSTKDRVRALAYPDLRTQLDAYTVGILRNMNCPSIATRTAADHAHILYLQHRTVTTADVVAAVKKDSSAWIKKQKPEVKDPYLVKFAWQELMITQVKRINKVQAEGEKWAEGCTLYKSKDGAPLVTYIHPGAHNYPAAGPELIVKFFQEHSLPAKDRDQ